jgi:hypothetical protein
MVWAIASIGWSAAPERSQLGALSLAIQILALAVLCDLMTHLFRQSLQVLALSTSALAVLVLLQPADPLRAGRASVAGVDENITAMVLSVGFAAALHLSFKTSGRWYLWWLGSAAAIGVGLLHTGSRTGAVAIAATLLAQTVVAAPLQSGRRGAALRIVLLAGAGWGAYALMVQWTGGPADRLLSLVGRPAGLDDSGRGYILALYQRWLDDWFYWGVGIGADAEFLEAHSTQYLAVHHLLWKTWVELGIVGVVLLFGVLGSATRAAVRSEMKWTILVLAAPLVPFALTLGGLQVSAFWLVVAWAMSASRLVSLERGDDFSARPRPGVRRTRHSRQPLPSGRRPGDSA